MAHNAAYICIIIIIIVYYKATYGKITFLFLFPSFSKVSILVSKIAIKFCSKLKFNSFPLPVGVVSGSTRRKSTQHQSSSIFYQIINPIQGAKICHVLAFGMHCQCLCMKRIIRDQCQVASEYEHVTRCNKYPHRWIPKANRKGPTTSLMCHDLIWMACHQAIQVSLQSVKTNGTSNKTED